MRVFDIAFDYLLDTTPPGKDPDSHSPRLKADHQLLWKKGPRDAGGKDRLLPRGGGRKFHAPRRAGHEGRVHHRVREASLKFIALRGNRMADWVEKNHSDIKIRRQ